MFETEEDKQKAIRNWKWAAYVILPMLFFVGIAKTQIDPDEEAAKAAVRAEEKAANEVRAAASRVELEQTFERNRIVQRYVRSVRDRLYDPRSVEWVTKAYNVQNHAVCLQYRANNAFGAKIMGQSVQYRNIASEDPAVFARYCPSGNHYELF